MAKLEQPPGEIQLPPLSSRPPSGKKVVLVSCPVPGCKLAEDTVLPAASLLGWHVTVLNGGLAPETYVAATQQALALRPDFILLTALQPDSTIKQELDQAANEHIPVASFASSDPPGGPMVATIFGQHTLRALGEGLAQWTVADSHGTANVVLLHDPSAASWVQSDDSYERTLQQLCPDCRLSTLHISDANAGTSIPGQVVSYLQAHMSVNYVISAFSGEFLGVPAAIRAAGMANRVKLGSATSTPADYALVKANDPPYTILAAEQEGGYRALDVFARVAIGDPIATCCTDPTLSEQLLTTNNIQSFDTTKEWGVPNLAADFANVWHTTLPPNFKSVIGLSS